MTNKEAISIITQIKGIITNDNSWSDVAKVAIKEAFELACKALEERPEGEWIMHIDETFPNESTQECNVCHAEQTICGNDDNFCPNCGAKMQIGDMIQIDEGDTDK